MCKRVKATFVMLAHCVYILWSSVSWHQTTRHCDHGLTFYCIMVEGMTRSSAKANFPKAFVVTSLCVPSILCPSFIGWCLSMVDWTVETVQRTELLFLGFRPQLQQHCAQANSTKARNTTESKQQTGKQIKFSERNGCFWLVEVKRIKR